MSDSNYPSVPDNPPAYPDTVPLYLSRRRAQRRAAHRRIARHNRMVHTTLAVICFFLLAVVIRQASLMGWLSPDWNLSGIRDALISHAVPEPSDVTGDGASAYEPELSTVDTDPETIPLLLSAEDSPDGDGTAVAEEEPLFLSEFLCDPAVWLAKRDAGIPLYPEDIYTPSPLTPGSIWYQGEWIPIYQETDALQLEPSDFSWSGDRLVYHADLYDVAFGVDVSAYQNRDRFDRSNGRTDTIDWEAARDDGVTFAIIRVGMRGYSEGTLCMDPYGGQNIDGAKNAGLLTGAYMFSQAITIEEAIEEAELVIDCLREHPVEGPVCYDWEIYNKSYRTYGLSPQMATACAAAFCVRVAMEGYTPMIYTDREISYRKYDQGALSCFMSWYPQYPSRRTSHPCPNYYYHVDIWQFSKRCTIAGIGTNLDGNLWFHPKAELSGQADSAETSPVDLTTEPDFWETELTEQPELPMEPEVAETDLTAEPEIAETDLPMEPDVAGAEPEIASMEPEVVEMVFTEQPGSTAEADFW